MEKKIDLFKLSDELKNDLLVYDLSYQTPLSHEFNYFESQETLKHLEEQQLFDWVFGNDENNHDSNNYFENRDASKHLSEQKLFKFAFGKDKNS